MGADYMLIPLMAAEQFGVNSLARAMAVILPVNTIGQTWFPYFVSLLRERFGSYHDRHGQRSSDSPCSAPWRLLLLPRHQKEMRHFTYKSLAELRQSCSDLGTVHVSFEPDAGQVRSILARKVRVGPVTVGNSLAIHPMEGCDGTLDGRPGELTWRRYERFARGGAKLLWFEATAINPNRGPTRASLDQQRQRGRLCAAAGEDAPCASRGTWAPADDLLIPMQLTHSGRYSVPRRIIAYHNPLIDRKTRQPPDYPVITGRGIRAPGRRVCGRGAPGAEAGFNAIDLKVTHGYLLNELLGAKHRPGPLWRPAGKPHAR